MTVTEGADAARILRRAAGVVSTGRWKSTVEDAIRWAGDCQRGLERALVEAAINGSIDQRIRGGSRGRTPADQARLLQAAAIEAERG